MDSVTRSATQLQFVLRATGLSPGDGIDPASVRISAQLGSATVGLKPDPPTPFNSTQSVVSVSVVLCMDTSGSLHAQGLAQAQKAAVALVNELPSGAQVGLVSFDTHVTVQAPLTTNHARVLSAIRGLTLGHDTLLYAGIVAAVKEVGSVGQRSVVLMTDGVNDPGTAPDLVSRADALMAVAESHSSLYAVALGSSPNLKELNGLARVGGTGAAVPVSRASGLPRAFRGVAASIASQLFVTAPVPVELQGTTTKLTTTATAGGQAINGIAVVSFPVVPPAPSPSASEPPRPPPTLVRPNRLMRLASGPLLLGAFPALFLGLCVILAFAFGAMSRGSKPEEKLRRRLEIYTIAERQPQLAAVEEQTTTLGRNIVARTAVGLADRVVRRGDYETRLGARLEAAGLPLRPAEWLIVHAGITLVSGLFLLLVGGGRLAPALLGLLLGAIVPWEVLRVRTTRRERAFLGVLPDTLQMLSGSLRAGYSLPQAIDSVARESPAPMNAEFNRALVENRLGVPIEDALEAVAARMGSRDFEWVVMAIRVQRDVGGNLAELLSTVSGTIRERERLRRQVSTLSAEGRLSAWILGLLPLVFAIYLILVRPAYIGRLFTDPLGWVMLIVGGVLLAVGSLWLMRIVKVDV